MKNFEQKKEMPMAAQNAKKLLEKYLEYIENLASDKGNTSILANEQIRLGQNQDLETPGQISIFVKELLSNLESGDHKPAMRFIKSRVFNSDTESVLSSEDNWEKVSAELEEQYGEIKPIEKEMSEEFKERVLDFFKKAPNTGSDVEAYIKNNNLSQLLGYLKGFSQEWMNSYIALHSNINETSLQTLVQESQGLFEELNTIVENLNANKQEHDPQL